jgi:hypothetical protein
MKTLTLALIAFAILFISCSQDESTKYENPPIILDENWVEITDTSSIEIKCLDGDKIDEKYIIRDSNAYNDFYEILWQYNDCPDYELPSIDFDKYTLLGYITRTGECDIIRQVFKNDSDKKIMYHLEITITSNRKILITNYNWMLIPKTPEDYMVIIDTTMNYNL